MQISEARHKCVRKSETDAQVIVNVSEEKEWTDDERRVFGSRGNSFQVGFVRGALFVPRVLSNPAEMIHGVHEALLVLGVFTILSTVIFSELKSGDGQNVSLQQAVHSE
ncbi:MAG TPA: hypothetical protein VIX91_27390 [Candidatus Acidoferrum sp.]